MRGLMLIVVGLGLLASSNLGKVQSQPVQFADPLAEEVRTLKAAQTALTDRVAELETAVAALPFRTPDPLQQQPARPTVPVAAYPSAPQFTSLPGGYVSVCDGNGCRVVQTAMYQPGQLYYPQSVSYSYSGGGGGCASGQCGVSVSYGRRGLFRR